MTLIYKKRKRGKIPEIIRESVSIVPSADYLLRLFIISYRKAQSILLAKIKMVSIQVDDVWMACL